MAHFEINDIEPTPEEKEVQKAKAAQVLEQEKQMAAKEAVKENKEEKQLGIEDTSGTYNYKQEEKKTQVNQSLFYPIAQAGQDLFIRWIGDIDGATPEEKEALKQATYELEKKYGADKIDSPEARFVVAEVTPVVRQLDKVIPKLLNKKGKGKIIEEVKPMEPPNSDEKTTAPVDKSFHINAATSK
ncbi:MAG: hypothetical protein QXW39_06220 [Candidatus Bathyarchaeia archaeon]